MIETNNNLFSIKYLRKILTKAISKNYLFLTMSEYLLYKNTSNQKLFMLRLDLDFKPERLIPIINLMKDLDLPLTIFIRVSGPYNFLWYPNYEAIEFASKNKAEIGLHSNPIEWSKIIGYKTSEEVFSAELNILRSKFNVDGFAPHRDMNYSFNSLPWLEENWKKFKKKYSLKYHAYEKVFFKEFVYINEGFNPHLTWRRDNPFDKIEQNENIYMLLHPHWWHLNHPFES